MNRLPAFFACLILLAACVAPVIAPAPTPVVVGVSIQEAQRMLDAATATAQAAATQSAQATAARVHEIEQLDDQMTRDASAAQIVAAQAQAEATRAALTPTAFALSLTQSAVTVEAQARATQSVVAAAATARGDTLKAAFGILIICLFAIIIYYLYWLGRVHIANLMFRNLGNGVVAELNPRTGWDTWQTQQITAPVSEATEPALTAETRAEHAQKAWLAKLDDDWRAFYRRLVMWAQYAGSWSNSALCDKLDVLSNEAWQQATREMVSAGYLIREGGKNKRETTWHPDWSYMRFMEQNRAGYVPHPAAAPPAIKPPHHITTTPQPVTASQQEITLYAHEDT